MKQQFRFNLCPVSTMQVDLDVNELPESEFDSCDPGMLTGVVEFCNRPVKSSKFAA